MIVAGDPGVPRNIWLRPCTRLLRVSVHEVPRLRATLGLHVTCLGLCRVLKNARALFLRPRTRKFKKNVIFVPINHWTVIKVWTLQVSTSLYKDSWNIILSHFIQLFHYNFEWGTKCMCVLDHPIVNRYFWHQSSTQILDKKLDGVLEP